MSTRKALCVGINVYKNFPGSALQGCVNDVDDMVDVLTKYLGFTKKDIVTLKDDQATKAAIMKNLQEMVDGAKAGKCTYLVYSHSGHGSPTTQNGFQSNERCDN